MCTPPCCTLTFLSTQTSFYSEFLHFLLLLFFNRVLTSQNAILPPLPMRSRSTTLKPTKTNMKLVKRTLADECHSFATGGTVNKIGADYVGMVVLGTFNAAIGRQNIRPDLQYSAAVRLLNGKCNNYCTTRFQYAFCPPMLLACWKATHKSSIDRNNSK